MDRGRCGYDIVANKYLKNKTLSHVRNVHLERLEKIKTREPGSSSTLDNNPPISLSNDKFSHNPRKRRKKTERNLTIARQNKVLLQRISNILTAPPKITDEEYQNMKKLITSLDHVDPFIEKLEKKKMKEFFDRVKNISPYYKHEEWEEDYEKQLQGQKFMRQVTYTRPDDWVDPFQEKEVETSSKKLNNHNHNSSNSDSISVSSTLPTGRSIGSSATHNTTKSSRSSTRRVSQIKELRTSNLEKHNQHNSNSGNCDTARSGPNESNLRYSKRSTSSHSLKSTGESVKSDSNVSDSRNNQSMKSQTHLLATCQRNITIQNQKDYKIFNPPSPLQPQKSKKSMSISPSASSEEKQSLPHLFKSQLSFQKRDNNNRLIPNNTEVTIMCSLITSVPTNSSLFITNSTTTTPTSSSTKNNINNPIVINTSNTISTEPRIRLEVLNSAIFYVTIDGTFNTKLRCDTQISLSELLHILHEVNNSEAEILHDESITVTWSEIESLSHQIIHQILLNYNEVTNEYSITLPEENLYNIQFRDFLGKDRSESDDDLFNNMKKEHLNGTYLSSNEAINILQNYKDVKFSCGMLVPYESTPSISRQNSSSPSSSSPRQQHILLRQRSNGWSDIKSQILPFKNEKIYCLIKMNQVTEDKAIIKCFVVKDSTNKFMIKGRRATPALPMDITLQLSINLPSILLIDKELIKEYFQNISQNLRIIHNNTTGENKIIL